MNSASKPIKAAVMQAIDTVLPPRCVITGEMVDQQGMIAPEAWAQLNFISAPQCAKCGVPFDFEVEADTQCAKCLDEPPPYNSARAALKYDDASRDLILGFKHADKIHSVLAFTPWLEAAGAQMLARADMLIPVPLHRWRLFARRYNQAALIAQQLSKQAGVQVRLDTLRRIRATQTQGHLQSFERHENVKRAFAMNPKDVESIKGKNIILIDDVYTTGATVKECAKVLSKAGAAQVDVLTLARVVREEFF